VIVAALAAVIAVTAWAIATYAVGAGTRPANHRAPTEASVLAGLTPRQRQYVLGIVALTPAQMQAAFGTVLPSAESSWMTPLSARERR
jgi:hypothetical protein